MTKEQLIEFWKEKLKYKILLGPEMQYIIEQTIKYLEEE